MRSKRNLLRYDGRFCVAVRLFACLFLTNFALIPGHSWTFRMSQDLSGSVYFDKLVSCGFPVTENLWHVTLQWCAVLGADHLTLEGGGGDFEKKFPASPCRKKKIACSTNEIEKKFLHCCKQEKKCCKAISSFQGDFTKFQQNCNHSSLAPFKLWSWLCFRMCNAFLAL